MAQQASLNLSVLDEGVEYPLTPAVSEGRCLIHVKLTESCAKAIDGLITSNKVKACDTVSINTVWFGGRALVIHVCACTVNFTCCYYYGVFHYDLMFLVYRVHSSLCGLLRMEG